METKITNSKKEYSFYYIKNTEGKYFREKTHYRHFLDDTGETTYHWEDTITYATPFNSKVRVNDTIKFIKKHMKIDCYAVLFSTTIETETITKTTTMEEII